MVEFKIQCEHCPDGTNYSWFTIAEWRSGTHSTRQLISLCERYHRIKEILSRIPEQTGASGNVVGMVTKSTGIGERAKHSCYAGITGVLLAAGHEVIGKWRRRDNTPEPITPDVTVLSNRQIAALGAGQPTSDRAERIIDQLLSEPPPAPSTIPPAPKPRRIIRDAPKPTNEVRHPKPAPKTKASEHGH